MQKAKTLRLLALTALTSLGSATALAQTPDAASEPARAAVTPPKLLKASQPQYPDSKLASGEGAEVALVLTLDAAGKVTDVSVSSSAGDDFDQAAIAAARELDFAPAERDGQPVPAKVPFRFRFEPQAPQAQPVAAATAAAPAPQAKDAAQDAAALDIDVAGERPPREPTQRSLKAEEITKIPGTNGDALRSVSNMPGVARVGAFDGLLIVRGSSPRDTQVFIDGTSVPLVYHFGGLSSVVPSEMLERIDFYPGNFGPQYGRATGGVIDVGVRSPRKDKLGGLIQADTVDARVLVEGPITKSTRIMLGARRSWLDAWLGPVLREQGVGVTAAPVYYDYQAMLEQDVGKDTTLRLFAFGSDDRLALTFNAPDSGDPAIGGDSSLHQGFYRIQGRVDTRPNKDTRWTTSLSIGHDKQNQRLGDLYLDVGFMHFEARSDLRLKFAPWATAVVGLDVQHDRYDAAYRLPVNDFEDDTDTSPLYGKPMVQIHGKGNYTRPGAYAMLELSPIEHLKLMPGVRGDYDQATGEWSVDPRIGARWDVHSDYPRTTLKCGAGVYHQPPEPYESLQPFGNDGLKPEKAYHYSLGVEQELLPPLELSVEGFYKDLRNIVTANDDLNDSANGLSYVNSGRGRSYGGEFLLRYKPTGRFFGWIAYTLSRSERRDQAGDDYYTYDFDQTHILTALASYKLGRGWQIGARWRYVTGSPYTPNLGGTVDHDSGTYAPVASPDRNSERLPAFHQLDLRVDKTWRFQAWSLSAYLDLQNAYNRQNTESISYNFDYSQTTPTHGLPILPVLGIRGEL